MTPAIQQAYDKWADEQGIEGIASIFALPAFEAGYNAARNGPSTPDSVALQAICRSAGAQAPITAETVYNAYPRKVGKQAALKAIEKAVRTMHPSGASGFVKWEVMLGKVRAYAAATKQWPEADRQYIPHPQTWFSRGSYDDDPKEWERGSVQASQFSQAH